MQLFHVAARIGNAVKVGTAELGLTLSCKSTLLANDKSLGPHLSGCSSQRFGDRNGSGEKEMCRMSVETHMERQAKGQESQSSVQGEL